MIIATITSSNHVDAPSCATSPSDGARCLIEDLNSICGGSPDVDESLQGGDDDDNIPTTGYEISEEDWDAFKRVVDGDAADVPDDILNWLVEVGLIEGEAPHWVPTAFGSAWASENFDVPTPEG